jgi:hypothetical protein
MNDHQNISFKNVDLNYLAGHENFAYLHYNNKFAKNPGIIPKFLIFAVEKCSNNTNCL